jgi:hypothetical protein
MKTSILALGVMLASPVGAYASESPNLINVIADFSPDRITANEPVMRRSPRNGATHSNPAQPTG